MGLSRGSDTSVRGGFEGNLAKAILRRESNLGSHLPRSRRRDHKTARNSKLVCGRVLGPGEASTTFEAECGT